MYIAKWKVLQAKHHKLHQNANGGKRSDRERLTQIMQIQQVMKVNPNPECKHQITQLHTLYRIYTRSVIGLSLY